MLRAVGICYGFCNGCGARKANVHAGCYGVTGPAPRGPLPRDRADGGWRHRFQLEFCPEVQGADNAHPLTTSALYSRMENCWGFYHRDTEAAEMGKENSSKVKLWGAVFSL